MAKRRETVATGPRGQSTPGRLQRRDEKYEGSSLAAAGDEASTTGGSFNVLGSVPPVMRQVPSGPDHPFRRTGPGT